jgi:hypothetical protein
MELALILAVSTWEMFPGKQRDKARPDEFWFLFYGAYV